MANEFGFYSLVSFGETTIGFPVANAARLSSFRRCRYRAFPDLVTIICIVSSAPLFNPLTHHRNDLHDRSSSCPMTTNHFKHLAPLRLALLEDLLDDLLLLDQESAGDTVTNAVSTSRATVRALDSLVGARECGVFTGSLCWDLLSAILVPCF